MSELLEMAFLLCLRGKDKGLKRWEILRLVETQLNRLENMEASDRQWNNFIRGGDGHG